MNQEAEGRIKDLRRMLAECSEVQRVMRITRSLTEEEVVFIEKAAPVFVRLVHSKLGIGKSKKVLNAKNNVFFLLRVSLYQITHLTITKRKKIRKERSQ